MDAKSILKDLHYFIAEVYKRARDGSGWSKPEVTEACNWAKFAVDVEAQTREKSYRAKLEDYLKDMGTKVERSLSECYSMQWLQKSDQCLLETLLVNTTLTSAVEGLVFRLYAGKVGVDQAEKVRDTRTERKECYVSFLQQLCDIGGQQITQALKVEFVATGISLKPEPSSVFSTLSQSQEGVQTLLTLLQDSRLRSPVSKSVRIWCLSEGADGFWDRVPMASVDAIVHAGLSSRWFREALMSQLRKRRKESDESWHALAKALMKTPLSECVFQAVIRK